MYNIKNLQRKTWVQVYKVSSKGGGGGGGGPDPLPQPLMYSGK